MKKLLGLILIVIILITLPGCNNSNDEYISKEQYDKSMNEITIIVIELNKQISELEERIDELE